MFLKTNLFKIESCREKDTKKRISYLRIIDKKYSIYFNIAMRPYNEALKKLKNKDKALMEDIVVNYIMKNHDIEITNTEMFHYWMIEYRAKVYIQSLKCKKMNDVTVPIILSEYFNIEFSRLGKILKEGYTTFDEEYGVHPFFYDEKKQKSLKYFFKKLKIRINR
jgi:hypothetical protein